MLVLLVSQSCLDVVSTYQLTNNSAHDYFGADGIVWTSLFNERTPQSLFIVGDTIHILWTRSGEGNRYNRSRDQGGVWDWCVGSDCSGRRVLSYGWESSIVARNSKVFAISYCWDCSPSSFVPFNRSLDGGNTWLYDTTFSVSADALGSFCTSCPPKNAEPNLLPTSRIIFRASEYGGGPRKLDSPVMDATPNGDTILLVVDGYDAGIRVKRSFDAGVTWGPDGGYHIPTTGPSERHPQVAYNDAGRWFVCFTDYPYIKVTYSDDYGQTWATPRILDTLTANLYYNSCHVSASLDYVSVVWFDVEGGTINVLYRESRDGGITWTPKENITALTSSADTAAGATVVNRVGTVYITWFEKSSRTSGNFDIMVTCKGDPDSAWIAAQNVSLTPGRSLWPMVAYNFSRGFGIVCWQDNTPGNNEIYCTNFRPLLRGGDDLSASEAPSPKEELRVVGRRIEASVPFEVYSYDGRLVCSGTATCDLKGRGTYIVRYGGKLRSIVVR